MSRWDAPGVLLSALSGCSVVENSCFGTNFSLVRGFALGGGLPCWQRAGNPPRRAGNFLLGAQKKVTKEEGLQA
jgi:hypothetical protein